MHVGHLFITRPCSGHPPPCQLLRYLCGGAGPLFFPSPHPPISHLPGLGCALKPLHSLRLGSGQNISQVFFILTFFFFLFLGPHLQHMEVPRLGVKSELQPPAYTTATTTQDLSCVCNLHHSSWQRGSLNPRSKARDRTGVLVDTSWACYC